MKKEVRKVEDPILKQYIIRRDGWAETFIAHSKEDALQKAVEQTLKHNANHIVYESILVFKPSPPIMSPA